MFVPAISDWAKVTEGMLSYENKRLDLKKKGRSFSRKHKFINMSRVSKQFFEMGRSYLFEVVGLVYTVAADSRTTTDDKGAEEG